MQGFIPTGIAAAEICTLILDLTSNLVIFIWTKSVEHEM